MSFFRTSITQSDRTGLRYWTLLSLLPAMAAFSVPTLVRADAPTTAPSADKALDNEPTPFMEFIDDHHGGGQLKVATATYRNDAGVTVHLVGAVHVAEKQYYEALNEQFSKYDALLYEMVKPANMGAPVKGQKSQSMIGMFQRFLKDVLELDFQLDDIDYTKPNFIHADLTAEAFEKMQNDRGESMLGLMLGQMLRQLAKGDDGVQQQDVNILDLIAAFNSPDRGRQFKLILGRSFGDIEDQMSGMEGTVLVTERNKKALSVLKDTIRDGKKKDIGIFYGAAHMHDMESRLALMGFKRTGIEWRTAWDMSAPAKGNGGAGN